MSFLCPGHLGLDHRLSLYFLNPGDGYGAAEHQPAKLLYWRQGALLGDLTVELAYGGTGLLIFPGHWAGRIIEGFVETEGEWNGPESGGDGCKPEGDS